MSSETRRSIQCAESLPHSSLEDSLTFPPRAAGRLQSSWLCSWRKRFRAREIERVCEAAQAVMQRRPKSAPRGQGHGRHPRRTASPRSAPCHQNPAAPVGGRRPFSPSHRSPMPGSSLRTGNWTPVHIPEPPGQDLRLPPSVPGPREVPPSSGFGGGGRSFPACVSRARPPSSRLRLWTAAARNLVSGPEKADAARLARAVGSLCAPPPPGDDGTRAWLWEPPGLRGAGTVRRGSRWPCARSAGVVWPGRPAPAVDTHSVRSPRPLPVPWHRRV